MRYIVNVDKGFEGHAFGESFDSDEPRHAEAANSGYLLVEVKKVIEEEDKKVTDDEPEPSGEPISDQSEQ